MEIRKRKLGKTNLMISEIGLGGIPLQRSTKEEASLIINEMINKKMNFIDTARGYTCSEEYLGYALKDKRDFFVLATKSMARSYSDMKKDIVESLKNLNTDYIDIYQLHNIKSTEELKRVMELDGAYKALVEAKASGKISHIGITSHNLDFLNEVIDEIPFSTIQFPYNILETKAETLFKKAKRRNIGVIVMKPFGGGILDNFEAAIKFVLNNEDITTMIPGVATLEELNKNTSLESLELNSEDILYIKEVRSSLSNDFCRRCGYCLPCTKGIDIPSCFLFEGYLTRYNLSDWARSRYSKMPHKASECINCLKCLERCPYNLDIPSKLKKVAKLFE